MPMNTGSRSGPRAGGFTLVELLTVIAIMAVLISLVVGAFTGVKNRVARENTILMFRALESALKRYYDDWGVYPWFQDIKCTVPDPLNPNTKVPIMDKADLASLPPDSVGKGLQATALLYTALNSRKRNGPYLPGSSTQAIEKKIPVGDVTYRFLLYVDGWGRPIMYGPPGKNNNAPPDPNAVTVLLVVMDSTRSTMPRLESRGGDEFDKKVDKNDKGDNLSNYNYDESLEDLPMYKTN
jgi:prepilin-type N-terminal cleavage/methylation domain-containing protein